MSHPHTAIRQSTLWGDTLLDGKRARLPTGSYPVLVIPQNPTARLAMIRRTVKTLWPRAKGEARERHEALVMFVLGTALAPSRR